MAKRLLIRGQTPLSIQKDGYTHPYPVPERICFFYGCVGGLLSAIILVSNIRVV